MKYSHLKGLQKHLQEASPHHFCPIYLIVSGDAYERKAGAGAVVEAIEGNETVPVKRLSGEKLGRGTLLSELESGSLFAQKRLVVVTQVEALTAQVQKPLIEYCDNPNLQVTLVLIGEGLRANSRLLKSVEKAGVVLQTAAPSSKEATKQLVDWLCEEAHRRGVRCDGVAAGALAKIGSSKEQLIQELEKLVCFVGQGEAITIEAVATLGVGSLPPSGWELGRAVVEGKQADAIELVRSLVEAGHEPLALLGQLRHQIQTGLHLSSILARGGSTQEITATFPYMKGWVLNKNVEMARAYGLSRYRQAILAIQETDLMAKNQAVSGGLLLELLVARIS